MSGPLNENATHGDGLVLPSERSTGLVLAGAAFVFAVLFRHTPVLLWGGIALAVPLAALALLRPSLLGPVNRGWFRFGLLLNKVVSPIVLFVLFAAMIVPYGLAMQLVRDPMRKRARTTPLDSYWVTRDATTAPPADMTRQF